MPAYDVPTRVLGPDLAILLVVREPGAGAHLTWGLVRDGGEDQSVERAGHGRGLPYKFRLGWLPYKHSREPGRTGLRGRLAASDRTNLIRVMPAKGGAGRPCPPGLRNAPRHAPRTSSSSGAGSSAWSRPGAPRSAGSPRPSWTRSRAAGP